MKGFHGTDKALVGSILKEGLVPSIGDEEWLGDGGYFFADGISNNPLLQAKQWAIVNSWDNLRKRNKYPFYAVLCGTIVVSEENFLDLTHPDGVEILEYIQNQCIKKLLAKRDMQRLRYVDGFLINFARGEKIVDVQVVKANCYIQLTKEERIYKISRRIPNCTICTVYDPSKNITNMEQVEHGRIQL